MKSLFAEALSRDADERDAFLAEACAGDEELRREVDELLLAHGGASSFLEGGPTLPQLPAEEETTAPRQRIGPYSVLRELGHGGMGTVYLASRSDDQYRKRVAIKLIRHGADSAFIVRRFKTERQILAGLAHPNIAVLLDGGSTEDGLPYFVMEYIEGEPIHLYCDRHRLTITERLEIFRTVCGAVQHAHQNLVVHRDIKPGNILVAGDGTPKLLDFGLAKLVDPVFTRLQDDLTATHLRMMTPAYASPEQIRGQPITTASDVYSLGVLLYVLLTGTRPYRLESASPEELMRAVCEQEPTKPSSAVVRTTGTPADDATEIRTPEDLSRVREGTPEKLRRRLSGDLDTIVLKALRKEPWLRYASADHLSEDLRRHLEGRPVSARAGSAAYRARKFAMRHRVAAVAAALVAVGVGVALWQARVATSEKRRAERRFNDLRELADSVMFEIHDSIRPLAGSTPSRKLLVDRALRYLDSLAREAADDPSLQRQLASGYERLGAVQAGSEAGQVSGELADYAGGRESFLKAVRIRELVSAADPENLADRRALATSHAGLGLAIVHATDLSGVEHMKKALRIREEVAAAGTGDPGVLRDLARSHHDMAAVYEAEGDDNGVLVSRRRELKLCEELVARDPKNGDLTRTLATSYRDLGRTLSEMGDASEGPPLLKKALSLDESNVRAHPFDAEARLDLAWSQMMLGSAYLPKDPGSSLGYFRDAVRIGEELAARDPTNARARNTRVASLMWLGAAHTRLRRFAQAAESFRAAIEIALPALNADPTSLRERGMLADVYAASGALEAAMAVDPALPRGSRGDRWHAARSWYLKARETWKPTVERFPAGKRAKDDRRVALEIARCEEALKAGG